MYKVKNIDTDKALAAIETFRCGKSLEHQRELYGTQKYYEGLEKGLELAESIFECSCYEKDESEPVHTKIQYNNHEYTIKELCQRMAELEHKLDIKERAEKNETG